MWFVVAIAAAAALGSMVKTAEARCALAEQVRLCANHASLQRATCVADDLDCQCVWAGQLTTCFAPCTGDKLYADGMQAARSDQLTVCAQAAKFGPLAKDRERRLQDERAGRRPRWVPDAQQSAQATAPLRNINELNAAHEAPAATPTGARPAAAGPAPKNPAKKAATAPRAAPAKAAPDADKDVMSASSAVHAAGPGMAVVLGAMGLVGIAAHIVPLF
ncbi:hypothetical protein H4R19_000239 [Coemansia spiralis]|nr:hypothetical protein H4R19_000239 [Coemansia spiralis]